MTAPSLLEAARRARPGATDAQHVVDIATRVIRELGESPPVSLEVVASYRDIVTILIESMSHAGSLTPEPRGLVMRLRADDSRVRRRFSGFHEVGHTFLPGYRMQAQFRCASPSPKPRATVGTEALADVAAAELLLPRTYFVPDAVNSPWGVDSVIQLSDDYEASVQATGYRYAKFWPEPVLMLSLEPGYRKSETDRERSTPKLRVRSSYRTGPWPFVPFNKSAADGGPLARALDGEIIDERASLRDLGITDAPRLHVSARLMPYVDGDGHLRQRVLALYRPLRSQ